MEEIRIRGVAARAYQVPTNAPEADGTFEWDRTTLVLVEINAGNQIGRGYTYADAVLAPFIEAKIAAILVGQGALDIPRTVMALWQNVRNLGRTRLPPAAISAVDTALWDLKAKLLGLPLAALLGQAQDRVEVCGSGGFTSYSDARLCRQLSMWVERDGCRWVKMKIGSDPARDPARVEAARQAIGNRGLFVDANGPFMAKQVFALSTRFAELDVAWFEEPVSSDDLDGREFMRMHAPTGMDIAAGEYGCTLDDFRRSITTPSIEVPQADATRCGGVTGFLQVGALCAAHHIDLSGHCAPALHLHVACAVPRLRHLEWFHDHVRIEQMLFEGTPAARDGAIAPDLSRLGLGLVLKERDAGHFRVR